jgi:type II secretory ATPase GspE/PulE/Tfp pilus assembly ATPase PilB-like protein
MGAKTEREDNINLLTVRQSPGYIPARQAVFDALEHGADSILFDYGAASVSVRHQIDGVWHNQQPIDRVQLGDPILLVFKTLAGLNANERRAKQTGMFGIEVKKPKDVKETKYSCKFASQGTQSGERVSLVIEGKKLSFKSLAEIGMREKMVPQLEGILGEKKGLILFSALPAGGLSTTFEVAMNASDRFMRNFAAVEEKQSLEREILNVANTPFDAAAGETPATVLPALIRTYPDVFVVRDVVDLESLQILVEQITKEERLVITTTRAKEAVEALLRMLLFKIPPAEFAAVVIAVVNVRLVRKLCETCKEAYPPPAEVLKQMGLPPGRIENFYRPPTKPIDPKHPEKVCEVCQGIGYRGRTGIFELLVVDDLMRSVLGSHPKLDALRDAARKSKHRGLQEEGLLLVAKGVTSLQELLRVLKQ